MRWNLTLLPGVKWSVTENWQRDVLLTMRKGHGQTDGRTQTHTPNKTSISIPTKFIGTKLKGQNKAQQDPHDKPTQ